MILTNYRVNNSKVYKCMKCGEVVSKYDRTGKDVRDVTDDGRRS